MKEFSGSFRSIQHLAGVWLRRSRERRRLRQDVGYDADRIQRLELDIGLPKGSLEKEMTKSFWQA
ncbi:MAG: hypothetical protein WD623_04655 [Marinobacter sp.]